MHHPAQAARGRGGDGGPGTEAPGPAPPRRAAGHPDMCRFRGREESNLRALQASTVCDGIRTRYSWIRCPVLYQMSYAMVGMAGFEPTASRWRPGALPLSYMSSHSSPPAPAYGARRARPHRPRPWITAAPRRVGVRSDWSGRRALGRVRDSLNRENSRASRPWQISHGPGSRHLAGASEPRPSVPLRNGSPIAPGSPRPPCDRPPRSGP